MSSLKTKFALSGATLTLVLVAIFVVMFLLLRYPQVVGLESRSAAWLASVIAALAIGSATWLAFSLGRHLTNALEQLTHSTNRISIGDFTQPVAVMRT